MPNRILKESIKTSPEIDKLSWFEECVFNRLIVTVDDFGCYDGRVIVLRNELFPTKDCITRKNVEDAIEKLEAVNLLVRYEVDGKPYIHLNTFGEHQRIRNKNRRYPAPPLTVNCPSIVCQLTADCHDESESESESEKKKNIKKKFSPPTLDEVSAYCKERNNGVDPKRFFDYYSTGNWKDSKGNPIINWKQKMIAVWEKEKPVKQEEKLPVYDVSANEDMSKEQEEELLRIMGRA